MDWIESIGWRELNWITPLIHVYALVVFGLTISVLVLHRSRLAELSQRIGSIAAEINGGSRPRKVRLAELTSLILYLGEVVERSNNREICPVLDFLKREELARETGVQNTLVNVTETMIELLPMLGILGTVWAISGVREEELATGRLLTLFGVAISSTLFALLYLVIFRLVYSAFVEAKVTSLAEHNRRFQEFLGILEKRARTAELEGESRNSLSSDPDR